MLKTVSIKQVRVGMFIHELKGAWVHHPFWKKRFSLEDITDLQKLKASPVQYVVIDLAKGIDVLDEQESPEVDCELIATTSAAELVLEVEKPIERISAQQEQTEAKRIIKVSKQAVASMLKDLRLGKAINVEAVLPLVDEISASITRNAGALISLVRLKTQDDYSYMHSVAVCALMTALAKQLELSESEIKQVGLAGLLHDVGKSKIPLDILNKPGALTDGEFDLVRLHPQRGYDLLVEAKIIDPVALDVCLNHHEKLDGSGYPHQLKDAKMGAVCDVYDAVTSNRPYKAGWEPGMSLKRMAQWTNHFDQVVFKAFVKSVGIYPIGSVVILKSGRLAVIIDQSEKSLLQPIVKAFFSTKAKSRIPIEVIDLSKPSAMDEIIGQESAATWGVFNIHELWAE
ncbi:MAG: HD-GYP domain-containing protein [Methylophilus sp.]|jgi:HD-GYP domain-containing protein (c-di-GMP phosphodiesterase class II)